MSTPREMKIDGFIFSCKGVKTYAHYKVCKSMVLGMTTRLVDAGGATYRIKLSNEAIEENRDRHNQRFYEWYGTLARPGQLIPVEYPGQSFGLKRPFPWMDVTMLLVLALASFLSLYLLL